MHSVNGSEHFPVCIINEYSTWKLVGSIRRSWQVPGHEVVAYVFPAQSPQNVMSVGFNEQVHSVPDVPHTENNAMLVEVLGEVTPLGHELSNRCTPSGRIWFTRRDVGGDGRAVERPCVYM
jgi:hypothetical protein